MQNENERKLTDKMIVEQCAELRAAQAVTNFMLMSFLENKAADAETLARTVDGLLTGFADLFEADLRKAAGMEPRAEPRPSIIKARDAAENFDWDEIQLH